MSASTRQRSEWVAALSRQSVKELRERCAEIVFDIEPDCPSITGGGRITAADVLLLQDGDTWYAYVAAGQFKRGPQLMAIKPARVRMVAFAGQVGVGFSGTTALVDLRLALKQLADRLQRKRVGT